MLGVAVSIKEDQYLNKATSLDGIIMIGDETASLSNIIEDEKTLPVNQAIEESEAFLVTKENLAKDLSPFEQIVLEEYLGSSTYKEIAINILKRMGKKSTGKDLTKIKKSIDNALLRIRKKAIFIKTHGKVEDIPLFIKK